MMLLFGATVEVGLLESIIAIILGIGTIVGAAWRVYLSLANKIDESNKQMTTIANGLQLQITEMKGMDLKQQFQIETMWSRMMKHEKERDA